MEIVLVLLPLYCFGYMIMFFKDRGDPFYMKRKFMVKTTPRKEFLQEEIKTLTQKIVDLESFNDNANDAEIEKLKKELKFRQDDLKTL